MFRRYPGGLGQEPHAATQGTPPTAGWVSCPIPRTRWGVDGRADGMGTARPASGAPDARLTPFRNPALRGLMSDARSIPALNRTGRRGWRLQSPHWTREPSGTGMKPIPDTPRRTVGPMHHPVTTGLICALHGLRRQDLVEPRPKTRGHQPPNRMGDPTMQP